MRFPGPLEAGIDRRARGHAAACRALLGRVDGIDHRAAVGRHVGFVAEVVAELLGRRHRIEDSGFVSRSDVARHGDCRRREGTLFVSAHRGNWVVGARALGDPRDPLHTVAGTQLHPRVTAWLERWLSQQGVVVHSPDGSWPILRRALHQGGRVFLHLDGDPYPKGARRWRPRSVPPGVRSAALLASRCSPRVEGILCRRTTENQFLVHATRLRLETDEPGPAATRLRLEADHPGLPEGSDRGTERLARWEALLLDYLRSVVAEEPEDWILFRDQHLGGGVRT